MICRIIFQKCHFNNSLTRSLWMYPSQKLLSTNSYNNCFFFFFTNLRGKLMYIINCAEVEFLYLLDVLLLFLYICTYVWVYEIISYALLLLSHQVVTPWTAVHQASLSLTISQSLLKLMSIESVMPSNHFILCRPLLFLPSIFPSIRVFQGISSLHQVAKILERQP